MTSQIQSTSNNSTLQIFSSHLQQLHACSGLLELGHMMSSDMSKHVALVFGLLRAMWALKLWIFATFKSNMPKKCPFHSVTLETVRALVSFKT